MTVVEVLEQCRDTVKGLFDWPEVVRAYDVAIAKAKAA